MKTTLLRKSILIFLIWFSCLGAVWSYDFSSYANKGPTLSGEINYFMSEKDHFSEWGTDVQQRVGLFQQAWGMATRSSPVDNRSYLFALAIDLYNTIPPDLMPEPREVDPNDLDDPNYHPPSEAPIKAQLVSSMRSINPQFKRPFEEESSYWTYAKKLPSGQQSAMMEMVYLTRYIRDQIEQGNIAFDAHDALASLPPEKLDITNPTYYQPLREYMERMQPAILAGVPPWEAEKYLAMEQSGEKPKQETPIAQQKPIVKPEPANEPVEPYAHEEAQYRQWILILALIAIGIAVIIYILRRPRK